MGRIGPTPLISIHVSCPAADILHTDTCDCRHQLDRGIRRVATEGGVVIRLAQKSPAFGTHTWDSADEAAAAAILADLGLTSTRLLASPGSTAGRAHSGTSKLDPGYERHSH
ncbi:hypothetical protein G6038_18380 [Rhodococcus sp. 14C212]|nr:hypothetical protein [Rhodococcus sp. 14C212]